jgi:polyvinyl alcohol dehydrogenase (cytochrome)
MSAAPTSTSELVFAGGFDGLLRAYDSNNGKVLWEFNTFDTFPAVNGDIARGGSIESDGPVLSNGHLLVNSGYLFGSRMPGNALLVFAPSERPAEELASE